MVAMLNGFSKRRKFAIDNTKIDGDLTDFPVAIPLNDSAGLGADDLSGIFTELEANVDDDFAGTNGDAPNAKFWGDNPIASLSSNCTIQSNKLNIAASVTGEQHCPSLYMLTGDFDVQVDFDLKSATTSDFAMGLRFRNAADDKYVHCFTGLGTNVYFQYDVGAGQQSQNEPTSYRSGKMKITRVGSTCAAYIWTGSVWDQVGTSITFVTDDLYLWLWTSKWTSAVAYDVDFDNFTINSGTLTWPQGNHANRKRIAVTTSDGVSQCPVEVEWFDHEKAMLHTKVPEVDSGADTDLYLYYNGSGVDNTGFVGDIGDAIAQSVWDSDFKAVCHMGNLPSETLKDSTGTQNLTNGNMEDTDLIAGQVDGAKAFQYDGSNEYSAQAAALGISGGTARTHELVAKVPSTWASGGAGLMYGADATNQKANLRWDNAANQGKLRYEISGGARQGDVAYDDDTWHHFVSKNAASVNISAAELLVDGVQETPTTEGTDGAINTGTTYGLNIGRQYSGAWYYAGVAISEVRISSVARSNAWLKATYHTLFDTFGTWGSEQIVGATTSLGHIVVGEAVRKVIKTSMLRNGVWRNTTQVKVALRGIFRKLVP